MHNTQIKIESLVMLPEILCSSKNEIIMLDPGQGTLIIQYCTVQHKIPSNSVVLYCSLEAIISH